MGSFVLVHGAMHGGWCGDSSQSTPVCWRDLSNRYASADLPRGNAKTVALRRLYVGTPAMGKALSPEPGRWRW